MGARDSPARRKRGYGRREPSGWHPHRGDVHRGGAGSHRPRPAGPAERASRPGGARLALGGEKADERTTPEEGAAHEPAGHDPLGTGAEPGDLTETDKGRIETAARNFVTSAYGYTGHEDKEYTTQLNRFIFPWSFYESPGAKYINEYRQRIRTGGTKSTATLERFELGEKTQKTVKGVAHFRVEDATGTRRMSQELELEPFEPLWRVKAGGEMKPEAS